MSVPDGRVAKHHWRFTLLLLFIAVGGAALVLAREITYGVGLQWDSVEYLSVARNLLAGNGFTRFFGGVYESFPPLYPVMLAVGSLGVFDPREVAGPLNAVLFGLTIFVAGQYLRRRLEFRALALWGSLALALSLPLGEMASRAMSETAFILFATLALVWISRSLESGRRAALIWAAVFSALACLTRFVGVTVVATTGMLLLFQRGVSAAEKAKRITGYTLISLGPVLLWMLRTTLLTGHPTGPGRGRAYATLHGIWGDLLRITGGWLDPERGWTPSAMMAGLALLALATAVVIADRRGLRKEERAMHRHSLRSYGGFALVYLTTLGVAVMAGGTFTAGIESRLPIPMYLPLVFVVVLALDRMLRRARAGRPAGSGGLSIIRTCVRRGRGNRRESLAGLMLVTALCLWPLSRVAPGVRAIAKANRGRPTMYHGARWAHSEILHLVRERGPGGTLYSNDTAVAYIHTDTLEKHRYLPCAEEKLRARLLRESAGGEVRVLWFLNRNLQMCDQGYGIAELFRLPGLEPEAMASDGVLFKFNRAYEGGADRYRVYRAWFEDVAAGEAEARTVWDVYTRDNTLIYLKEPCIRGDHEALFMLHVIPVNTYDLPRYYWHLGYDNLDFAFDGRGLRLDGHCMMYVELPGYPVSGIRTGQFIAGEGLLWQVEFRVEP